MAPSAFFHHPRRIRPHDEESASGALVIAILFALLAAISFGVDLSLSLPD